MVMGKRIATRNIFLLVCIFAISALLAGCGDVKLGDKVSFDGAASSFSMQMPSKFSAKMTTLPMAAQLKGLYSTMERADAKDEHYDQSVSHIVIANQMSEAYTDQQQRTAMLKSFVNSFVTGFQSTSSAENIEMNKTEAKKIDGNDAMTFDFNYDLDGSTKQMKGIVVSSGKDLWAVSISMDKGSDKDVVDKSLETLHVKSK